MIKESIADLAERRHMRPWFCLTAETFPLEGEVDQPQRRCSTLQPPCPQQFTAKHRSVMPTAIRHCRNGPRLSIP